MRILPTIRAALLLAAVVAAAEHDAAAQVPGGIFGPGHDPLRPAPVEPAETGPGITSATLVAAGDAEIEELPDRVPGSPSAMFVVVLDVSLAAGTTTVPLHGKTITAELEKGDPVALFAACTPTATEEELRVFFRAGTDIAERNVAIDGRTLRCGGRTARMSIRVGQSGFRLTTNPGSKWQGQLVLFFEAGGQRPRRIVLPGAAVDIPVPEPSGGKAN